VTELRRELGLLDATMINVGTMIASAIFIVPATVLMQVQTTSLAILAWVAGGVVSLLGALSGVEMGLAAAGVPHRAGGVDAAMTLLEGRNEANSPAHLKVIKT